MRRVGLGKLTGNAAAHPHSPRSVPIRPEQRRRCPRRCSPRCTRRRRMRRSQLCVLRCADDRRPLPRGVGGPLAWTCDCVCLSSPLPPSAPFPFPQLDPTSDWDKHCDGIIIGAPTRFGEMVRAGAVPHSIFECPTCRGPAEVDAQPASDSTLPPRSPIRSPACRPRRPRVRPSRKAHAPHACRAAPLRAATT